MRTGSGFQGIQLGEDRTVIPYPSTELKKIRTLIPVIPIRTWEKQALSLSRRPRLDVGLINFDVPAGEKTKNSYEVSRMSEMKFQVWTRM